MLIFECAADGCSFRAEMPDGSTVKGKPAVQWWSEDCNYRCHKHRDGTAEHDAAIQVVQSQFGAVILEDHDLNSIFIARTTNYSSPRIVNTKPL